MFKKLPLGFAFHVVFLSFSLFFVQAYSQSKFSVIGTVTDSAKNPLPGVSVWASGTRSNGTATDVNGKFVLDVTSGTVLIFKFVGYNGDTVAVTEQKKMITVVLRPSKTVLKDFVVTAFGKKQIKESVVGSVVTIKPDNLRTAGSNLTNALAGQVAGIIGGQSSGQPGLDNSNFFIRGVTTFGYRQNPLILIDNVELTTNDLARLQVNDIASFSILKDASATALYGARGANGVILVTTKEGKVGKTNLNLILENAISKPTQTIKLADPITYMKMYNEATTTRDPLQPIIFDADKIYNTEQTLKHAPGSNPYVYPAVDWLDMLFKKSTSTQRANLNVSGGGDIARFIVSGSFSNDNGMLKKSPANNFNNNVNYKNYQLRSNVNVNLTKTTEMVIRLWGNFNDYNGPMTNDASFSSDLYSAAMHTSPVLFPAYYQPDSANRLTQHILFGNSSQAGASASQMGVGYSNPYAQMLRGYKRFSESRMSATLEIHQDLDFVVPGLKLQGFFNTNRYAYFDNTMAYNPFYYTIQPQDYNKATNQYALTWLNSLPGGTFLGSLGSGDNSAATEYLQYSPGKKDANTFLHFQAQLEYAKQLHDHNISASLIGVRQQKLIANGVDPVTQVPSLQYSLPYRNLNLAGRVAYNYLTRYFVEFNFGYNGSERFSENHRFGFFPTIGASWMVSKEKFWSGGLADIVSSLKLRASYGLSGNDDIGQQRFFYLSDVNLNAGNGSSFGLNNGYSRNGVSIRNYENRNVTWETAKILNTGVELTVLKDIDFIVEYWKQDRRNILMKRNIPSSMGLEADILTNKGTVNVSGLDLTANINHNFSKDLRVLIMSNLTYSKGTYGVYEEPQYAEAWRYRSGTALNQQFGYIAERLFVDDKEAAASPTQQFGGNAVKGGDIKYRDLNGDGRITVADMAPIGYPTVPQIMYGFGFSVNYKGIEFNARFQGQSRVSLFIDPRSVSPFVIPPAPQIQGQSQVLKAFADNHWSEENQNLYALYPRLGTSSQAIENNLQSSTWWMRDGSFLRLKTAEIGYALPPSLLKKLGLHYCRIYVNGINLFNITRFNLWDPELGGNGFNYPIQKAYNIGININI